MKLHLLLLLSFFGIAHAHASSLCSKNEKIVFECELASKKSVALCLSNDTAPSFVEYRYGRLSKVEMRFRADENEKEKKFHRAEVVYASNASDVIWFRLKKFVYQIHLPARGGPLLEVLRDEETISHHSCSGGWAGVRGDVDNANSYYINHGTGSVDTMERLWNGK
jgi:hypothetical protein